MQKTFDASETTILNCNSSTVFLINEETKDVLLFPLSHPLSSTLIADIQARGLTVGGVIGFSRHFDAVQLSLEQPISPEMSKRVSAAYAAALERALDPLERMFLLPDTRPEDTN